MLITTKTLWQIRDKKDMKKEKKKRKWEAEKSKQRKRG